ncbi:hypothetical protein ABZ348_30415 [Streptomyces sp. NPDC005963]|uniref:hypothetical protein n=1 Tax=Streptomyces sp. NPDC005963 TaxID=3156721 RepID=UPI00340328DF
MGQLHRQILDSRDAGLAADHIAHTVSSRIDADAADRILTGHDLAHRLRGQLTALGEERATSWISDYATGTVRASLCSTPAHEHFSETLIMGWDCMEVEEPEEAAAFPTADLGDAQALLATLYDVLTPSGAPATAKFLTPWSSRKPAPNDRIDGGQAGQLRSHRLKDGHCGPHG